MNFVITKTHKVMESKYIKYLQLSVENIQLNSTDLKENQAQIGGKWLSYVLMATALILWIVFNIVAIESYQFSLYALVFMNLILYCIIACMTSHDHYNESSKK